MRNFMYSLMVGLGIGLSAVACSYAGNTPADTVHTVDATFYEAHDRGDGVYDVTVIIPETADPDCGDFIYAGFYDDDPVWKFCEDVDRGKPVEEHYQFLATVNYNGNWEIMSIFYHEIPVEWR